jgi:uncharacterized MnhB-related membrane protein
VEQRQRPIAAEEITMYVVLVGGLTICAIQAMRAHRLLEAALWLAGVSALVSILLYTLGAPQVAVIELSVGAGLVTVLFVYAIGVAGEATHDMPSLIPRPLAWGLILLSTAMLGWLIWPMRGASSPVKEPGFTDVLWEGRALDVWLQILIVFSGVLGILGLVASPKTSEEKQIEPPAQGLAAPRSQISPEEVR